MRLALFTLLALALQRLFAFPGVPGLGGEVLFPVVILVGPRLLEFGRGSPWSAVALGLAWDALLEPVIGPGGIAWSAAALTTSALAGVLADRSPRAWFVGGCAAATVILGVRRLALLPLGIAPGLGWGHLVSTAILTGVWCAVVGWLLSLRLPERWRALRTRKLR